MHSLLIFFYRSTKVCTLTGHTRPQKTRISKKIIKTCPIAADVCLLCNIIYDGGKDKMDGRHKPVTVTDRSMEICLYIT